MSTHHGDCILQLDIHRIESELYEVQISYAGHELESDCGFSSISAAIEAAAGVTSDVRGFEVSYAGLVVGTFPLEILRASPGIVAERAVQTAAWFRDH